MNVFNQILIATLLLLSLTNVSACPQDQECNADSDCCGDDVCRPGGICTSGKNCGSGHIDYEGTNVGYDEIAHQYHQVVNFECPEGTTGGNMFIECFDGVVSHEGGACHPGCPPFLVDFGIIGSDSNTMETVSLEHGESFGPDCPVGYTGKKNWSCSEGQVSHEGECTEVCIDLLDTVQGWLEIVRTKSEAEGEPMVLYGYYGLPEPEIVPSCKDLSCGESLTFLGVTAKVDHFCCQKCGDYIGRRNLKSAGKVNRLLSKL